MPSDPIVDEIRAIRERHAAKFGFDVHAIAEDARQQDAAGDREVVRLPPRRPVGQGATPGKPQPGSPPNQQRSD